jgi:UDP-N-acetylglucosamine--N-acetylmuramyl-(pentapeptide) pyrophosphoryl-undecaprenol N-acetylglucosamine transferase
MKKIVLTGGGTAGHVMPNLALVPRLQRQEWEIAYIGSRQGIEKDLLQPTGIPYYGIATGKFRRYFALQNFTDPFRVMQGLVEATLLLRKLRPDVVFSKGGFVSVPVTIGAWLNRIPVILHESDLTPGLANKLALPFAATICATFPESMAHLPKAKRVLTGNPIRSELLQGSAAAGLTFCGFTDQKPVLAVMGGSLGSKVLNQVIRAALPDLLPQFQVAHICGKGNLQPELEQTGYRQFEFIGPELPQVLAAAKYCVSRAGANFIFELLALKKPALLIPLSKAASRGDQILNAESFAKQGFSLVLYEEATTPQTLLDKVQQLTREREKLVAAMAQSELQDATGAIIKLITNTAGQKVK